MLDAMGGLGSTVEEMRRRFQRVAASKQLLEERRSSQQASVERAELLRFQLEELTGANLQVGRGRRADGRAHAAPARGEALHAGERGRGERLLRRQRGGRVDRPGAHDHPRGGARRRRPRRPARAPRVGAGRARRGERRALAVLANAPARSEPARRDRRPPGRAVAPEAQVRRHARGAHRASATSWPRDLAAAEGGDEDLPALDRRVRGGGEGRRHVGEAPGRRAPEGGAHARAVGRDRAARARARRRAPAGAVRGGRRTPARGRPAGTTSSSTWPRTPARSCARSRASRRAASCRASCSR